MGSIVSIGTIISVGKLVKLHSAIKGKWITFFYALLQLKKRRRSCFPYFPKHDCMKSDAENAGLVPFKQEWENERPSKVRKTTIMIV